MRKIRVLFSVTMGLIALVRPVRADEAFEGAEEASPPVPRTLELQPAPLTSIGGAEWNPGLGLVAASPDGASAVQTAADSPAGSVPSLGSASLTELGIRAFGGLDTLPGVDSVSPTFGLAVRYEARRADSLLAPWAEGGFSGTIHSLPGREGGTVSSNDSEDGELWDLWLRGGLDVHPGRERWIGAGPFLGYRQLHARQLERSAMVQGLDVGAQIHLRTSETVAERPKAELIAYGFVQGAGLAEVANRTFVGALVSAGIGEPFSLIAQLEGCASSPDTCFPRQVRAVAGLGGAW
jgi:hypothetical protein